MMLLGFFGFCEVPIIRIFVEQFSQSGYKRMLSSSSKGIFTSWEYMDFQRFSVKRHSKTLYWTR